MTGNVAPSDLVRRGKNDGPTFAARNLKDFARATVLNNEMSLEPPKIMFGKTRAAAYKRSGCESVVPNYVEKNNTRHLRGFATVQAQPHMTTLQDHNSWWIIETIESHNGMRVSDSGNFMQWFSTNAFGGTNYSNTPVGAVSHVDEPYLFGANDAFEYFNLWAKGKSFGLAAWNSRITDKFQAVGDPFVTK